MSKLVSNYDGGTTDQYGTFLALNRFLTGEVIEGLAVTAQASPNMTVLVGTGSGRIPTGTSPNNYGFFIAVDTSGGESVTIGTADASARIDYIVAYIDLAVSGSTSPTDVNNKNNVLKFADVKGTPSGSPVVPTVSQIQTTIGASNPYIILAQIAVAASASQITNPNITDVRSMASPIIKDGGVAYTKLARVTASGTFSKSATGDTVITGLGFRPRTIKITAIFQQGYSSTHNLSTSIGQYDRIAGTQNCIIGSADASGAGGSAVGGSVLRIDAPLGTNLMLGTISATSTDGFTFNASVATATVQVIWEAFA